MAITLWGTIDNEEFLANIMSDVPEAVSRRCSVKMTFFKISQNLQENTLPESLFNKVAGLSTAVLNADSSTGVLYA